MHSRSFPLKGSSDTSNLDSYEVGFNYGWHPENDLCEQKAVLHEYIFPSDFSQFYLTTTNCARSFNVPECSPNLRRNLCGEGLQGVASGRSKLCSASEVLLVYLITLI